MPKARKNVEKEVNAPAITRFLLKLLIFILLSSIPFFCYMLPKAKKGLFYYKTTYSASSLIIGASRAQMGLDPAVIEKELNLDHDMLNFAFNGTTSPYGEPYLKLIERKLKPRKTNDAIFILSVNPGNISSYKKELYPVEEDFRVYDMWNVNMNPNIEFVARNPNGATPLVNSLTRYFKSNPLTRKYAKPVRAKKKSNVERGSKKKRPPVSARIKRQRPPKFRPQKVTQFTNGFQGRFFSDEDLRKIDSISYIASSFYDKLVPSEDRYQFLEETIDFLRTKGTVFLVRTPEHEMMVQQFHDFMPDFTAKMEVLTSKSKVHFLDYSSRTKELKYHLYDNRTHLEARSARAFSRHLSKEIVRLLDAE